MVLRGERDGHGYFLEGLFTILCAIVSFWAIQDFPETAQFLTESERRILFVL